jgi:hypothetical protein
VTRKPEEIDHQLDPKAEARNINKKPESYMGGYTLLKRDD